MKRKKTRGFTLIECLIALAVFGIAALSMAQIYAMVGKVNMKTHSNNTSLAYQMKIVEKAIGKDANSTITIQYKTTADKKSDANKDAPHKKGASINYVKITSSYSNKDYSYGVDTHVILTRYYNGTTDKAVTPAQDSADNLRYKYFIGTLGG